MCRDNVINLISISYQKDSIKQEIPTEIKRQVYCSVESISRSEFFDAGRNGIKPQYKITMFEPDYGNEPIVELDNARYSVYRTYASKNDVIELYLVSKVGI